MGGVKRSLGQTLFSAAIVTAILLWTITAFASGLFDLFSPPQDGGNGELKEIHRLHTKGYINAVAWSADGSRLAALSNFGWTITLWDTKTWKKINQYDWMNSHYSFNSLAFLPDNTLLTDAPWEDDSVDPKYTAAHASMIVDPRYTTLKMYSLIQWNPEIGKPFRYIPDLGYPPKDTIQRTTNTFAVSKDYSLIAVDRNTEIWLYEAKSASLISKLPIPSISGHPPYPIESIAFSPDGREVVAGTLFGKLYFFDVVSSKLLRSFDVYPEEYSCNSLAYNPDGKFIAVGRAKVINVKEPDIISTEILNVSDGAIANTVMGLPSKTYDNKEETARVSSVSWNPAGDILAIGDEGSLRVWRIHGTDQTLLISKKISHGVYTTAFSPNGMLAANDNDEVVIYQ